MIVDQDVFAAGKRLADTIFFVTELYLPKLIFRNSLGKKQTGP
jgi:hypothetical protein